MKSGRRKYRWILFSIVIAIGVLYGCKAARQEPVMAPEKVTVPAEEKVAELTPGISASAPGPEKASAVPSRIPTIRVDPPTGLPDGTVRVRISGIVPGRKVTLRAQMDFVNQWESHAIFTADSQGEVDLVRQAPVAGTYTGIEPQGIFWSMSIVGEQKSGIVAGPPDPVKIHLTAEVDGKIAARAEYTRIFTAPGVTRHPVRGNGLVGTFFLPPGKGPFPGVVILGGEEGALPGWLEAEAALFASRGFGALALAYFGIKPLPAKAIELPVEYFGRGVGWLQNHEMVDDTRIGIVGMGLGGQAALLAGAFMPDQIAVAGIVPVPALIGAYQWGAAKKGIWEFKGKTLPHIGLPFCPEWCFGEPGCPALCESTVIPVQRINGPVLLISGGMDYLGKGREIADIAARRMERDGHRFTFEHRSFDRAGHILSFPYVDQFPSFPPGSERFGTPSGNAHANVEAWRLLIRFFRKHLSPSQ